MQRFIRGDFAFVLQGQSNVVQPIQQAVAYEFIDGKLCAQAVIVADFAPLQVDGKFIILELSGAPHYFSGLGLAQADGEKAILRTVVGEDVSERR